MSFFHKVREIFGGAGDKMRDTPSQPKATGENVRMRQGADSAKDRADGMKQDPRDKSGGMRDKVEDKVMDGIDSAARAADRATGGKYRDQINKGADAARRAADKIDGEPG
ncbi:hypothetical protein GCM10009555_043010 [Acrocarpospora macrocephala]|uniref:Antitoxin n=1 Tax=Acrocarpospora macrocephala TaxID=150177 RepID=A0A5M3X345_9ACTN|nr:Rv0909 family putative TA system antitoxin [Acrocarpospora macrocephala]GES15450.1 hypothetical protein Amac_090470 [Acrocarpospora macrocephala]